MVAITLENRLGCSFYVSRYCILYKAILADLFLIEIYNTTDAMQLIRLNWQETKESRISSWIWVISRHLAVKSTLEGLFCNKYSKIKANTWQMSRILQSFCIHFSEAGFFGRHDCLFLLAIAAAISSHRMRSSGAPCCLISAQRNYLLFIKTSW